MKEKTEERDEWGHGGVGSDMKSKTAHNQSIKKNKEIEGRIKTTEYQTTKQ